MENIEVITLQRARNFSRKMNATFEFIKINFKSLMKSILIIAGPSILIGAALMISMMGSIFGSVTAIQTNPDAASDIFMSVNFWLEVLLLMVFLIVSMVMTLCVVNNYIVLYDEKKTHNIAVADVWERTRKSFWKYVGALMLIYLLLIGAYLVSIGVMVLLGTISPVLIVFGVFGAIALVAYVAVSSSLMLFALAYENRGIFNALSRSFKLIQGKWWRTFGYFFIIYMITMTLNYIFIIPAYIFMGVGALHSIDNPGESPFSESMQVGISIVYGVFYFASLVTSVIPVVAVAFQYFNLVELKESRGLMTAIENIDNVTPDAQTATDEQY